MVDSTLFDKLESFLSTLPSLEDPVFQPVRDFAKNNIPSFIAKNPYTCALAVGGMLAAFCIHRFGNPLPYFEIKIESKIETLVGGNNFGAVVRHKRLKNSGYADITDD